MALYMLFGVVLGFAVVGSVEARMRRLLRPHDARLAQLQGDLLRVERKLDDLSRHSGLHGTEPGS
jgi:hypothetical protein